MGKRAEGESTCDNRCWGLYFKGRPDGINLLISRLCVNNCSQLGPVNWNTILSSKDSCNHIFSPVIETHGAKGNAGLNWAKGGIGDLIVMGHVCSLNRLFTHVGSAISFS